LQNLVQPIQPLWSYLHAQVRTPYYWTTEQSEWASDFVFTSPASLADCYDAWIKHGVLNLQCHDVLRYLGKKVSPRGHTNAAGEVKIDCRQRTEGTRLKFWYDSNSLKIYDKEKQALRIETTINQPKGFRVFRNKENDAPDAAKAWHPMRKGVADLARRAEVSQAANNRLAESLASVAEPSTLGELLAPLGRPVLQDGRRKARALNPLTGAAGQLLRALAQGEFLLQGFRNRDLRHTLYGASQDPEQRRKQAAAVTRQLALLRAHGIIVKVPKSHRYHLSAQGRRIVTCLLTAHASNASRLASSP